MRSFLRTIFATAVSLFAFVSVAQAMPYIDPQLRPLLNADKVDKRPVRVYVRFHDAIQLPNAPRSRMSHRAVELAMMQNAKAAQAHAMQMLTNMYGQGTPIRAAQLWLFNGMIVELPADKFSTLTTVAEVKAIHANYAIKLLDDHTSASTAPAGKLTWGLEKIGIPELSAKAPNVNGQGVTVGVLDTGIDATHPDLKGRLALWHDFAGNSATPIDEHGHGTHVSGTISGGDASGTRIGVAPGVKIIMGRIFDASGSTSLDVILRGMQWMADPDGNPNTNDFPSVVSNSWGGQAADPSADPNDNPMCAAVNAWVKLGMVPVFAAGNSGPGPETVGLPAACPAAIAVGATTPSDGIASFSSRGPAVWKTGSLIRPVVSAPGQGVTSSVPGGKYATWDGTSMATPHVAGLVALMFQLSPGSSVDAIAKGLMAGADDLGAKGNDNDFGWGRINVMKTLQPAFRK